MGGKRKRWCVRGHDLDDPKNQYRRKDGQRVCLTCKRDKSRAYARWARGWSLWAFLSALDQRQRKILARALVLGEWDDARKALPLHLRMESPVDRTPPPRFRPPTSERSSLPS